MFILTALFIQSAFAITKPPCGPLEEKSKWSCTKGCEAEYSCSKANRADVVGISDKIYDAIEVQAIEIPAARVAGLIKGDVKSVFRKKILLLGPKGSKGKLVCFRLFERFDADDTDPVETGYHYCDYQK
jgi:hypothetical protein